MVKFIMIVLLLAGALLGYNYTTTGEVTLIPSFTLSEEEQQVKNLEELFQRATREFSQAERGGPSWPVALASRSSRTGLTAGANNVR